MLKKQHTPHNPVQLQSDMARQEAQTAVVSTRNDLQLRQTPDLLFDSAKYEAAHAC